MHIITCLSPHRPLGCDMSRSQCCSLVIVIRTHTHMHASSPCSILSAADLDWSSLTPASSEVWLQQCRKGLLRLHSKQVLLHVLVLRGLSWHLTAVLTWITPDFKRQSQLLIASAINQQCLTSSASAVKRT